ncbi:PREDICTED: metalloendoase [Prunus dulcis]|uniref:PREDICTED: metalloendoase n=1 Tax=Prunus dulcis TaxID=3755 RepID=A0A5E4EVI9_PRUDU|nr:PREDICTED: metalloendoase [Prunus dulcis]
MDLNSNYHSKVWLVNENVMVNMGTGFRWIHPMPSGNQKWPPTKHHLTTYKSCNQAFGLWAKESIFTFQEVGLGSPADLRISFQQRDQGDGSPFDGPGKVLAHRWKATRGC